MRLQLFAIGAVPAFLRGLTDSGAGNGEFHPRRYGASSRVKRVDHATHRSPQPPRFGSMAGGGCDGCGASPGGVCDTESDNGA